MTPGAFGTRLWRSRALLALGAGAAAALGHPPFGLPLLGLAGWGVLFWLWDRSEGDRPLRSAFWAGWRAAFAYFLIGCWWVAEAFLVDAAHQGWMAPIAITLLPAGLGLFWGAAAVIYRRLRPPQAWAKVLLFAGALSLLEWLRGHLLTGFPWNLPGETWLAGSAMSQGAALVGAYGLSWITLALSAALSAPLWLGRSRQGWGIAAVGALVMAALFAFGAARLARPAPADPAAPWVRVVQADVPQAAKYDEAYFRDIVERYVRLTAQPSAEAGAPIPAIVIWPEGAIPAAFNDYMADGAWTQSAILGALRPGQTLMVGAYRVAPGPDGPVYYNSLISLMRRPDGADVTSVYDKHRLVPFGEYLPLDRLLTPLGIKNLVHIGDGFSAGPPPRPVRPEGVPAVQPLICYESLYPGFARAGARLAGRRPRWIVNVSNDAWFGQTSGPRQHLNLASYRAIEEGLPIVRATPTGISAVVDATGGIHQGRQLELGQSGVIDFRLPAARSGTSFSLIGEIPFWLILLLSFICPIVILIFGRKPGQNVSQPT